MAPARRCLLVGPLHDNRGDLILLHLDAQFNGATADRAVLDETLISTKSIHQNERAITARGTNNTQGRGLSEVGLESDSG